MRSRSKNYAQKSERPRCSTDSRHALLELVENLEKDKMKLTDTLRQQTERRMRILNDFVMRRGSDLKKHGEFLVQMA